MKSAAQQRAELEQREQKYAARKQVAQRFERALERGVSKAEAARQLGTTKPRIERALQLTKGGRGG